MNNSTVLIHDGSCVYCAAAADLVTHIDDDVGVIEWSSDVVQEFLTEQFESTPFSMGLVDLKKKTVYLGQEAMSQLVQRAGVSQRIADRLSRDYAEVAPDVSRATNKRQPSTFHGKFNITSEDALDAANELWEVAQGDPLAPTEPFASD
jgi:transcription antitermination factor NusA-like protein